MKRYILIITILLLLVLTGCSSNEEAAGESAGGSTDHQISQEEPTQEGETENMKLIIGEIEVPVTWEDNESVSAIKDLLPLTIQMSMYGGNEQVGSIGQRIVSNDKQTRTKSGDIVLYTSDQIVIFYGSNSWAYTRLGHVDLSKNEMKDLLGNGNVSIQIVGE